mmetsp:Transcript_11231/g.42042  ORF Transcript_11231/g.42042 Transcript_11231/m.42042 type:complete len:209 (+) Transcript_11231:1412-2038(+)
MHVLIRNVARSWLVIWLCANSHQSLIENVHAEWIHRTHQHIDSQVEFVSVQKVGITNVVLYNCIPMLVCLCFVLCENDASALAPIARLDDKHAVLCTRLHEIREFVRQNPGVWEESILLGETLLHAFQVFCHGNLTANGIHPRKVIDNLKTFEIEHTFWSARRIHPEEGVIVVTTLVGDPPHLFAAITNQRVFAQTHFNEGACLFWLC